MQRTFAPSVTVPMVRPRFCCAPAVPRLEGGAGYFFDLRRSGTGYFGGPRPPPESRLRGFPADAINKFRMRREPQVIALERNSFSLQTMSFQLLARGGIGFFPNKKADLRLGKAVASSRAQRIPRNVHRVRPLFGPELIDEK